MWTYREKSGLQLRLIDVPEMCLFLFLGSILFTTSVVHPLLAPVPCVGASVMGTDDT